jgi:hypothetical protein
MNENQKALDMNFLSSLTNYIKCLELLYPFSSVFLFLFFTVKIKSKIFASVYQVYSKCVGLFIYF